MRFYAGRGAVRVVEFSSVLLGSLGHQPQCGVQIFKRLWCEIQLEQVRTVLICYLGRYLKATL